MTYAVRAHTTNADGTTVLGGHCYILFPNAPVTVAEIIAEKVRCELRKARAGGMGQCSVGALVPDGVVVGFGPVEEAILVSEAKYEFVAGTYTVVIDGVTVTALEQTVRLTKQTVIAFVVEVAELAAQQNASSV